MAQELKRFNVIGKYTDEETMYEFRPDGECYDADEVDAVLAEKDAENRRLQRALWLARAERAKERKWHFDNLSYLGISTCTINFQSARIWMTCKIEEPSKWVVIFETVERKCRAMAERFKE